MWTGKGTRLEASKRIGTSLDFVQHLFSFSVKHLLLTFQKFTTIFDINIYHRN